MTVASPELKHPEFADGQSSRVQPLRMRPAWSLLEAHCRKLRDVHLRQLFAEDPDRGERLATQGAGIYLDYSKNRVTDETVRLLLQLAHESDLRDRIDAMFRGDYINVSENRAVLHVALRAPRDASSSTMAIMLSRRFMPFWTEWPISPTGSVAAYGRVTRASASEM